MTNVAQILANVAQALTNVAQALINVAQALTNVAQLRVFLCISYCTLIIISLGSFIRAQQQYNVVYNSK